MQPHLKYIQGIANDQWMVSGFRGSDGLHHIQGLGLCDWPAITKNVHVADGRPCGRKVPGIFDTIIIRKGIRRRGIERVRRVPLKGEPEAGAWILIPGAVSVVKAETFGSK